MSMQTHSFYIQKQAKVTGEDMIIKVLDRVLYGIQVRFVHMFQWNENKLAHFDPA